jgi:hypothetical protein
LASIPQETILRHAEISNSKNFNLTSAHKLLNSTENDTQECYIAEEDIDSGEDDNNQILEKDLINQPRGIL